MKQGSMRIKKTLALFVIFGTLILVPIHLAREHKEAQRLIEECTAVTTGYVDDKAVKRSSRYSRKTLVTYHYDVNGTRYTATEKYKGYASQFNVSESYPLHYSPENPKDNYLGDTPPESSNSKQTGSALIVVIITAICLLIGKKKSNASANSKQT